MEWNGMGNHLAHSSAEDHHQMLSVNDMIECSLKVESCLINFLSP